MNLADVNGRTTGEATQTRLREMQESFGVCKTQLKRKVSEVTSNEEGCEVIRKTCRDNSGEETEVSDITEGSLGFTLHFPHLSNLYRFEANCLSGIFAKSLEPMLITDEMRGEAAKVKMPLVLQVNYDDVVFKEIEDFLIQSK